MKLWNSSFIEAEKGKVHAVAEKRILEMRVNAIRNTLREVGVRLKEVEMQKRLLERESQSYKNEVKETQLRLELENKQLAQGLSELRLKQEAATGRIEDMECERAALKKK